MHGVGVLIWTLMGIVVTLDAATWAEKGASLIAAEQWKEAVAIHHQWTDAEPTNGANQGAFETARDDGTVRQLWETSTDLGASWAMAFDDLYARHRE